MSNLDHIDLKLSFVFSKSSILILFFILQGIIMSLIIESIHAADVQSRVVTKKNYNPFASLLEIESFPKEPLQHFNSKEPQQSEKVNPELTSKQSASDIYIKLLDILQTSSGTFALVRVKDQEYWVQQGEWLEDFEVFEIKEDKLVLKQTSLGSGNAEKRMEIGFQ